MYEIEDTMDDRFAGLTEPDDIEGAMDDLVSELSEMLEQCQGSLDNMPESLQESSSSGEMLQERIYGLEGWIGDIESIDCDEVTGEEVAEQIEGANPGMW